MLLSSTLVFLATLVPAGDATPSPSLPTLLGQPGTHESTTTGPVEAEPGDPAVPAATAAFLTKHCADCHGDGGEEGGFAIEQTPWLARARAAAPDQSGGEFDGATFDRWVRLLDRVADGEMPPEEAEQPTADERAAFTESLRADLVALDRERQAVEGRGRIRRLNRSEYETALADVLGRPLRIADRLPEDARRHGFDTVGEALNLSSVQVESYLEAIDAALDEATHLNDRPATEDWTLRLDENVNVMQTYRRGMTARVEKDGVELWSRELFSHYNGVLPQWTAPYEGRYRITVHATAVRTDEPIVLTLRAGGTGHSESQHVPSWPLAHWVVAPNEPSAVVSDPTSRNRRKAAREAAARKAAAKANPEDRTLRTFTWEGRLLRGHFLHIEPSSMRPMRYGNRIEMKLAYDGPAVLVGDIDVSGPHFDAAAVQPGGEGDDGQAVEWPPLSHRVLWGGVATEQVDDPKPLPEPNAHLAKPPSRKAEPKLIPRSAAQQGKKQLRNNNARFVYEGPVRYGNRMVGGEPIYRSTGVPKPITPSLRLAPSDPHAEARRLLRRFVPRALRRDAVSDDELAPYVTLAHRWLDDGATFEQAMRTAYAAVLCSPEFLYRRDSLPTAVEPAVATATNGETGDATSESPAIGGPLSNEALAERLAFFLWNGPPDADLRAVDLSDRTARLAAAERLLADDRSERFLTHFLDEWLDLRLIDFTAPDSALYPEHDALLQWSMLEETRGYVRTLLADDRPVHELVESDWAMLNWRLASHYDLAEVADDAGTNEADGMSVRPVPLPAGSVRGGVLTQAAILKITANGTTTSPVVRGVWVLDRVLGQPPSPPPPGVPAIEPDIRGATTIREQLDRHRADAACASCHAAIDPPGLALESFDVIGQFRRNYRKLHPEFGDAKPDFKPTDSPLQWLDGPPVDASGTVPVARPREEAGAPPEVLEKSFRGIRDYKAIVARDRRGLARAVVEKFVIYATGAAPSLAARDAVEAILDAAADREYGLRTLLRETIASDLFTRK